MLPSYVIGGELGRGAMGVVIEGRHASLDRPVAIKELPVALSTDESVRERFRSEARLLAKMDHPHIVPVYDYVEQHGTCVLVMEQLTGGTVWSRFCAEGMSHQASCAVVLATCAALQYAHEREVLHRDVKPENILFSAEGTLKVTDFGIAKVLSGSSTLATAAGGILGTPAYIAPEQALGDEVGPPADVFAAGVMLYELLSGQLPYSDEGGPLAVVFRHAYEDATPLSDVAPQVPRGICDVVDRALRRDPADRYPTAEAFGVALAEAAANAWGPEWMAAARIPLRAGGPIVEAASRPTIDFPFPPAPADASALAADPSRPEADHRSPVGVGAVADVGAPPVGDGLGVPPAPPSGDGGDLPPAGDSRSTVMGGSPPPVVVVRPERLSHEGKAQAAELDPEELVAVEAVIEPPAGGGRSVLIAGGMLAATLLLGAAGLGSVGAPDDDGSGTVSLDGRELADSPSLAIDFADSVDFVATDLPAGAERVRIDFSAGPIPLASSSSERLEPAADGGSSAVIEVSANRFLASGPVAGELLVLDGEGEVLSSRGFVAEPTSAGILTLGGVGGVALLLVAFGYAESFIRPLRRRGSKRWSSTIGLAVVGVGVGVATSLLSWAVFAAPLSVATTVLLAALGAGSGVAAAVAAAKVGRRRRVKRILEAQDLWSGGAAWSN